jgi:hypothetical protein
VKVAVFAPAEVGAKAIVTVQTPVAATKAAAFVHWSSTMMNSPAFVPESATVIGPMAVVVLVFLIVKVRFGFTAMETLVDIDANGLV